MAPNESLKVQFNVPMKMRDGTILRGDVYRPEDTQKHPALFLRTYGNKRFMGHSYLDNIEAVRCGYAVILQDVRGMFASEGEWKIEETFNVEGPDGYDSVEWIANQSWCDGNVGTIGGSHQALYQWLTALEHPPHLKAISPWIGDIAMMGFTAPRSGGILPISSTLSVIPRQAVEIVDRLEKEGKDVSEMRRTVDWARNNRDELLNFLPLKDLPLTRFERIREMLTKQLRPVTEPELESHRRYHEIMLPCFHLTGWYDGCHWSVFHNFLNMRQKGGSQLAREGQYLLVGPWMHGTATPSLGDINFGVLAGDPGAQISQHILSFFDKYFKGKDNKIPTIRYFVMGIGEWKNTVDWPPPQTQWQRFYLHSRGSANSSGGDGLLSRDEPGSESPDIYIYNPLRPIPTVGGPLISGGGVGPGMVAGPFEQSRIEKRNDILCYTTPELREKIEVTGPLEFHLFAASSAKDTDFTAKLIDVYPDGGAFNVAEGIIRASGRRLTGQKELLNPGEVYEFVITMGHTSQCFLKNHRIRIDISSSNF